MTLFSIALVSSSSWTVIGAPLGNHLWQSTVFAGAVWLLTLLLRKNRAQSRYVLWVVASAKFLLPFSLLVALGSHLGWSRGATVPQPRLFIAMESIGQPFDPAIPVPTPAHAARGAFATIVRLLPASLLTLWTVGCVVVLFVWYLRWRRLTAIRRAAPPSKSGRELEVLRRIERTSGLSQQIDLVLSKSALEPGILGVFRPALLLPAGISEKLTDAQLESVIAHELCHVRRRDNLAAGFHMFVEALFWFHPLVWWMGAQLVEERERACDEEVLRLGTDPHVYAEGILKVCKFYLESPLSCAAGVTGSNLKKRIEAIMIHRSARKLDLGMKLLLAAISVVTVLGPIGMGFAKSGPGRGQSQPAPAAAPPSFQDVSLKLSKSAPTDMTSVFVTKENQMRVLTATNVSVKKLVAEAYGLHEFQISGGPDWMMAERYDLTAKLPDSSIHGQLGRALENLIADRFKLTFHREAKVLPVYELVVSKNGSKLSPVTSSDLPATQRNTNVENPPGHLVAHELTMRSLTGWLTDDTKRIVLDKTGLQGSYSFTLDWTPSSPVSFLAAISEQLGLELREKTGPVEMLVIDHAEQVTANESSQAQAQAGAQSVEQPTGTSIPVSPDGSLTCTFASVKYPEGTVIQEGNGPEQLCARVLDRGEPNKNGMLPRVPEWIHTNQSIRERGRNIVHLPVIPIAFCTPKPSTQSNLCSCEESGFFSENSDVDSAQGKLSCKKGKWVPMTVDHAKQATTEEQTGTPRLN